jgi:hypothetical protein
MISDTLRETAADLAALDRQCQQNFVRHVVGAGWV